MADYCSNWGSSCYRGSSLMSCTRWMTTVANGVVRCSAGVVLVEQPGHVLQRKHKETKVKYEVLNGDPSACKQVDISHLNAGGVMAIRQLLDQEETGWVTKERRPAPDRPPPYSTVCAFRTGQRGMDINVGSWTNGSAYQCDLKSSNYSRMYDLSCTQREPFRQRVKLF